MLEMIGRHGAITDALTTELRTAADQFKQLWA